MGISVLSYIYITGTWYTRSLLYLATKCTKKYNIINLVKKIQNTNNCTKIITINSNTHFSHLRSNVLKRQ